jgi:hypothetical protein
MYNNYSPAQPEVGMSMFPAPNYQTTVLGIILSLGFK